MGEKKINQRKIEPLVDDKFIIEMIGCHKNFLRKAREQMGLPYYKIGKSVKYKWSEVEAWIIERKVINL